MSKSKQNRFSHNNITNDPIVRKHWASAAKPINTEFTIDLSRSAALVRECIKGTWADRTFHSIALLIVVYVAILNI